MLIQLISVTDYGNVWPNHCVHVLRTVPVLFKQPDPKGSRVDLALFPLLVVAELPPNFKTDLLMDSGWRSHHERLAVDNFDTLVLIPGENICKSVLLFSYREQAFLLYRVVASV